jgi:hypothetical protein
LTQGGWLLSGFKVFVNRILIEAGRRPPPTLNCVRDAAVWVGASRNLDATKNGFWFTLRNGSHTDKSLQAEWNLQGEPAFQYDVLEKLDEDVHPLEVADRLKEKRNYWIARLGAQPL